ncbi:hypothetical protein A2U01_0049654 [Trifolium medium]|uniref:Uncharacterized protein n=1 Tax=Trifolium medium TaxID=97028 RepID=A0A392QVR5_9FABA|nr:hypothetical protein [Trifolium medium]
MASESNNRINNDQDTIIRSPPREHDTVLSPARNNEEQIPENNAGDPRDGEEASPFTED